jgi:demethylmenaquinone methyltransferase/2-methoxy-6-polyprenyl-1,4-benzoquinol methylase
MVSRVLRSRQAARTAYDRLSPVYSTLTASEAPLRRKALSMLRAQTGERVLEIGFGPGESLLALARVGATAWGIDLSLGMARAASARLCKAGFRGQACLCTGDAARLPYAPGAFDAVFMTFTLELFDTPEIPAVLGECRRVLALGGRLCTAAMALPARPNAMVRVYEWFHRTFPAWADCRPIPLRACLEEAGFDIREEWHGSTLGLPVAVVNSKR